MTRRYRNFVSVYKSWMAGDDVLKGMSRSMQYYYRNRILEIFSADIFEKQHDLFKQTEIEKNVELDGDLPRSEE